MDAPERREALKSAILTRTGPLSASELAGELGVSRQVIVGDIALLRAAGLGIIATARGYMIAPSSPAGRFSAKLACRHSLEQTENELSAIVELGGEVVDVVVAHYLYGEITGGLNISTREGVRDFVRRVRVHETRLLSELTDGVHLHTVSCPDKNTFDLISAKLLELGILYRDPAP
ncbi:MAG: transcription repressor NadR [Oscillospiraceae bacterium]|jgi:transcriptional regulator of NAD metabolism|nr:transcription repressor NadR [Oscillospiraceae bacterium]